MTGHADGFVSVENDPKPDFARTIFENGLAV